MVSGAVAQLGERLNGIQEVVGSTPIGSTIRLAGSRSLMAGHSRNPGELPTGLTPEALRAPHASVPRNPLLAEPLFLAHYIERASTGTVDMIAQCREANLPEPTFEQRGGQFVTTLWRGWLTAEVLAGLELNDRQRKAIVHVKTKGRIANTEYQQLTGAIKKTASRDLDDLVQKGIFAKSGTTGRGTYYVLIRKGGIKGTLAASKGKGDIKGTKGT